MHWAHVAKFGVPVQLGTWNSTGFGGKRPMVPQQIRSAPTVQSLSDLQDLGQLDWQTPPQHRGFDDELAQSESLEHVWGHAVAWRQIDFLPMEGSRPPALAQQISPDAVSQSVFCEHVVGQLFAAVQIGVE